MQLSEYLAGERGRVVRVAKEVGIAPAFLSQISNHIRPAPAVHCRPIVKATGSAVQLWDLRPNDWHRLWPEAADDPAAPEMPAAEGAAA